MFCFHAFHHKILSPESVLKYISWNTGRNELSVTDVLAINIKDIDGQRKVSPEGSKNDHLFIDAGFFHL